MELSIWLVRSGTAQSRDRGNVQPGAITSVTRDGITLQKIMTGTVPRCFDALEGCPYDEESWRRAQRNQARGAAFAEQ